MIDDGITATGSRRSAQLSWRPGERRPVWGDSSGPAIHDDAFAVLTPARGRVASFVLARGSAYAWATLAVSVAGLVAATVEKVLPLPNLSLVFLSAVLLVGVRLGTAPALYAAGLAFAVYNFCFTAPYYNFVVHNRGDVLTLLFFILVAVLTGNLAGKVRSQLEAVRESARRTTVLYDFARTLADAMSVEEVLDTISRHAAITFGTRSLVFLSPGDRPGKLLAASMHPRTDSVDDGNYAAAEKAWCNGEIAGCTWGAGPSESYFFAPMKTGHGIIGLVGLAFPLTCRRLSAEQQQLFEALTDQSAVALERIRLAGDIEKARVKSEAASLRTALLSSISHDLRTPLSSIIGSATTLASVWESLSSDDRCELTETILEESNRLDSLVQNLLDMTRIEHGGLEPRRDWVDLREIVGRAIYRLQESLMRFRVNVDLDEVPLLYLDPVLMEQVFVNILENAAKHAPAASAISLLAERCDGVVQVRIEDEGPGIAPADRRLIFEMFFCSKATDLGARGTGLGLSICKAFVEIHGGTIVAETAANGSGTAIVVSLPVGRGGHIETV